MNKRGVALYKWVVYLVLLAAGCWLGGKYVAQLEKTEALSMQAMLVETTIAQEQVFAKTKQYTTDWTTLLPLMTFSPVLQVETKPLPGQGSYFFGFGSNAAKNDKGFEVHLQITADGQSGTVTATRIHSLFYSYQLIRAFPNGEITTCTATKGKSFCKHISQDISALELNNLAIVPAGGKDTSK